MIDQQSLKVLYLSAEAVPFAKTGGLADVAGSLPKAIRCLGHDIRLAMPRYGRVEIEKFGLVRRLDALPVPMDERTEIAGLLEGRIGAGSTETPVYFVDSPRYFDRQGIYMYPDDAERFIFFSMGIPKIGSMRQRGHHAIELIGRAQFDDPDLFDLFSLQFYLDLWPTKIFDKF